MKSKHLTYFKVEGFKLFKSVELHNIAHINIIIGDNNTGKISLLEALLFNKNISQFNISLAKVLIEYRNLEKIRDAFDTGIHPLQCLQFWWIITQIAKEENVQLFVVLQNPINLTYIQKAVENNALNLEKRDINLYCLTFNQEKNLVA